VLLYTLSKDQVPQWILHWRLNWLGEKPLASVRKNKVQEAQDLGVVICGENPNCREMVENI